MLKKMLIPGLLLALFAAIGTASVAFIHAQTAPLIANAEQDLLLANLNQFVPTDRYDNDMFKDTLQVQDPLLGTKDPVTVYRARKGSAPIALVLTAIAPDGYSGPIKLLIGINYDGTLAGVRAISHQETPGLGDNIDVDRSPWIKSFTGKSLQNPSEEKWHVKKDGGVFDQFTGATITPRAVVKAVANTLRYYQSHRDELFAVKSGEKP